MKTTSMNPKNWLVKTGFVLGLAFASSASAGLIGDTVAAQHLFPNSSTVHRDFGTFVVEAGTGDVKTYPSSGLYSFNIEAESVLVDFHSASSWTGGSQNGLAIQSLDWVNNPSGIITGLSIDTNLAGWDDSRATFTDHSVQFNWASLSFNANSYFDVDFVTSHASTVPEPTSFAIFGIGAFGLMTVRRRRNA